MGKRLGSLAVWASLGTILLLGGVLVAPASAADLSSGCQSLNSPLFDTSYSGGGLNGPGVFAAGEMIVASAGPPNSGAPTTVELAIDGVDVDTAAFPGTVQYRFPAAGSHLPFWSVAANVRWTVSCALNAPPTAAVDSHSTNEDTALSVPAPGVLGNDGDPDVGDTLTAVVVSGPSHAASFTLNGNGSFSYTPAPNYNGPDSFTYKVRDTQGAESETVTVTLTVNAVNDPPTATADGYTATEDNSLDVAAPGVLGNDSDPDVGDSLTAVLVSGPAHAQSFGLLANGQFSYLPAANYNGPDSFTYKARDNHGAESATVTVSINVTAVDDPPSLTVVAGGTCNPGDFSGTIRVTVSDVDSPVAVTALTGISSNTAVVPNSGISFAGSGANWAATISGNLYTPGTAFITITALEGSTPVALLTVVYRAGGNGDDVFNGSFRPELFFGWNGNDTLNGMDGADLLCGSNGNDILNGGNGNDSINGGNGDDTIDGGNDADTVTGGNANDNVTGGAGNDTVDGGEGHDTVAGGADNDIVRGSGGNDTLRGEAGNDTLTGGGGGDSFSGGADVDVNTDFLAAQGDTTDGT